jgi:sugar phosphate permease
MSYSMRINSKQWAITAIFVILLAYLSVIYFNPPQNTAELISCMLTSVLIIGFLVVILVFLI